jgi:competence protein ComEA
VVQVLGGRVVEEGARRGSRGGWVPAPPGVVESSRRLSAPEAVEGVDLGADPDDDDDLEEQLRRARRPSLLTVPATLRTGRVSVTSSAVVAVLALVVALGCAFVLRVLWAERAAEAKAPTGTNIARGESGDGSADPVTPEVVSRSGPAASGPPGSSGSSAARGAGVAAMTAGASAGQPSELVVHVVGQVAKPGLVRLRVGARVADAIEAAGGATGRADLAALNLARALVDGEQVLVPKPGEQLPASAGPSSPGGEGTGGAVGAAGSATGLVNLNTADVTVLESLPGVGPVLAQRIVDWRTEHGRFTSVEELGEVSGIGDKMLSQLRSKVTV